MSYQTESGRKSLLRFETLTRKFIDLLDSAQISAIAYNSGGEWRSLSTLIKMGGSPGQDTYLDVEDKLLAVSKGVSPDVAASTFRKITESGRLTLDSREILTSMPGEFNFDSRSRPYFYSASMDPGPNTPFLIRRIAQSMDETVGIRQNPTVWEEMDDHLRTLDPPFTDIADLAEWTLGYPIGRGYDLSVYGLLLLPFKVLGLRGTSDGSLQLDVRCHSRASLDDVSFGLVTKPQEAKPKRLSVRLSAMKHHRDTARPEVLTVNLPVMGPVGTSIHLIVRGEPMSVLFSYPGVLSPRLRCHQILDPDGAHLEKAVIEHGGEKFEAAVCMLLHLAGFKVEWTGLVERVASGAYVDIVALSPDEQIVILASCVSKNPSSKDISLLAQSYLSTKESLGDRMTILPALFTQMSDTTMSRLIRQQAEAEDIRLFGKEDLGRLIETVKAGGGVEETLRIFRHWL